MHPVEMKRRVHDFASTAASVVASFVESKLLWWSVVESFFNKPLCVCFVVLCFETDLMLF